jgi:hypothetical protein
MNPQGGPAPFYAGPQGFIPGQEFNQGQGFNQSPGYNPGQAPSPQRLVLGGGDAPAFQQPGMPTQPGANYNAPPAMVMANMAAHLPASQPKRVPLGVGQNFGQSSGAMAQGLRPQTQQPLPLNLGPTPVAQANPSARSPIYLPGPESFGLVSATTQASEVDWVNVRSRIKALAVRSFNHEELPTGRHRFTCQLQSNQGGLLLVEGAGATESEAIEECLAKATQIRQGR